LGYPTRTRFLIPIPSRIAHGIPEMGISASAEIADAIWNPPYAVAAERPTPGKMLMDGDEGVGGGDEGGDLGGDLGGTTGGEAAGDAGGDDLGGLEL
jgi:hypothetical protein